jgi:hypothetical protein
VEDEETFSSWVMVSLLCFSFFFREREREMLVE